MPKKEFNYIHWRNMYYKLREEYLKLLDSHKKLMDKKHDKINDPYKPLID